MRRIRAIELNRKHKYGAKKTGIEAIYMDMEGCFAELAAALALGLIWPGEHDTPDYPGDLIDGLQVRGTTYKSGKLILHPSDRDDHTFVLVCGKCPTYNVVGWIAAEDGKDEQYWCDPTGRGRHAYFVPQNVLRPMYELKDQLEPQPA